MAAYHTIVWLLGAQCALRIQGVAQYPGQQVNAMSFQSRIPYSYPPAGTAQNLLRPQQGQQMFEQPQLQQQQLQPVQMPQLTLQQRKDAENARLWREAEEEERREEQKEQEALIQQKKQQQLVQLSKQEQAHPAPPAESSGPWTKIQAVMHGVSLQVLYNVVLFAIASSVVAFSMRNQVASALNQTAAKLTDFAVCKTKPPIEETPSSLGSSAPLVEEDPAVANQPNTPLAVVEKEAFVPKPATPEVAKGASHMPRPPAERRPQSNSESTPIYLCEATIHKYDGMDALQKALKTHSERVAQGTNKCIVIAGSPGKEATTCAQQ